MALQTIDDDSLAESLFEVFQSYGYEGATLSILSKVTGLKKSSLYYRFPAGKDDMARAVVLYVSTQIQEHIIEPLLNRKEMPEKRFNKMISTVKVFYNNGKKNCLLNVLNIGEANTEINELLNSNYNAWIGALIKLGKEAGLSHSDAKTRSEHFLIVIQGALVIQRLTNNSLTFQNSMEYEKKLFFGKTHVCKLN